MDTSLYPHIILCALLYIISYFVKNFLTWLTTYDVKLGEF